MTAIRWTTVTLDCADVEPMASFYADLLGWPVSARDGAGWAQLLDPNGGVGLNLQAEPGYVRPRWPEEAGKQTKMLHLELLVEDVDAAVEHVARAGGAEAPWQPPDRDPARLRVMLDPAGHPFCLFVQGE
jgi:catechol 2,3-dioxygenase-like lactoylglutathione lyase family enzyme